MYFLPCIEVPFLTLNFFQEKKPRDYFWRKSLEILRLIYNKTYIFFGTNKTYFLLYDKNLMDFDMVVFYHWKKLAHWIIKIKNCYLASRKCNFLFVVYHSFFSGLYIVQTAKCDFWSVHNGPTRSQIKPHGIICIFVIEDNNE